MSVLEALQPAKESLSLGNLPTDTADKQKAGDSTEPPRQQPPETEPVTITARLDRDLVLSRSAYLTPSHGRGPFHRFYADDIELFAKSERDVPSGVQTLRIYCYGPDTCGPTLAKGQRVVGTLSSPQAPGKPCPPPTETISCVIVIVGKLQFTFVPADFHQTE